MEEYMETNIKRHIMILLLFIFSAVGCTKQNQNAYDGISKTAPNAVHVMANDAANCIVGIYTPGQTTLAINTDNGFGRALEAALKNKGFSTVEPEAGYGTAIKYSLDFLKDESSSCYMRISVAGGSFSQLYSLNNEQAVADGSLSKIGLDEFDISREVNYSLQAVSNDLNATSINSSPLASEQCLKI